MIPDPRHATSGSLGTCYSNFFSTGGMPSCPDVVVAAVEAKAMEHLERLGKGDMRLPPEKRTVASVVRAIFAHQGIFLMGQKDEALSCAVAKLVAAVRPGQSAGSQRSTQGSESARSERESTKLVLHDEPGLADGTPLSRSAAGRLWRRVRDVFRAMPEAIRGSPTVHPPVKAGEAHGVEL